MKVVVLGAGVVGTTAAWYLRDRGLDVEVIDRQDGAGLETSFANGGQVSACHAAPWANPGAPLQILKWMGKENAPLLLRPKIDPDLIGWGIRFLRNCTWPKTLINVERALRVALLSRANLKELRSKLELDYHHQDKGIVQFCRDQAGLDEAKHLSDFMGQYGLQMDILDQDQLFELEPALASSGQQFTGGCYAHGDESGDAHLFTQKLAEKARHAGVTFRYGTTIDHIDHDGLNITQIVTDEGLIKGDVFLVCLGSYSSQLLKPLGLNLPIYPCKGYSVTLDVSDANNAPNRSLTDEQQRMVFSRFGDRLRIAGTAEITGYNLDLTQSRLDNILDNVLSLFPGCADRHSADLWTALRPVTPDSVPIIGATRYPNLYLNTGHGTLGWTMACGSGDTIAALIAGEKPPISLEGLGIERF